MSTRAYNTHTESTTQPPSGKLGDEWYNPITGTLYKYIAVNGTNVQWTSSVFGSNTYSISNIFITGGTSGQALITNGSGNLSFGSAGATIATDNATNANTFYPTLSTETTGLLTTATIANTKLYFNPSTGTLNATIFNSLSDETKKTSIASITDALNKVKQLSGVTYNFIDSSEPSAGLIAQQVEKVLPEAVKYNPEQQTFSLNYNGITGLLVEAIKILSDERDQLANTVNALSERIAELEKNAKLF